jgi:primosomal protein N' (replication factor Y)
MARIILRGREDQATAAVADKLAAAFGPALESMQGYEQTPQELRVLGPAEAPLFRLKNHYRYHFQLQSPSSAFLHQVLRHVLPSVRIPSGIELSVDIDPLDML